MFVFNKSSHSGLIGSCLTNKYWARLARLFRVQHLASPDSLEQIRISNKLDRLPLMSIDSLVGQAPALLPNITLGWRGCPRTNILAYLDYLVLVRILCKLVFVPDELLKSGMTGSGLTDILD